MHGFLALIGPARAPSLEPADGAYESDGVRLVVGPSPRTAAHARRGPMAAVADLRLDNRDELRAALRDHVDLRAVPTGNDADADTALLLAAHEAWGPDAVGCLDGPFAYVVWDGRERRAFFARDGLGLRPLYRARIGGRLVLGTSLPKVLSLSPGHLSPDAVADHLAGTFGNADQTVYEGIERVPAGVAGTVTVERRQFTLRDRRYWSLDPVPTLRLEDDAAYADAFRRAFDRAVGVRMGGHPAAFLSGGLDSSSIVVTARTLRPETALSTLSIVYKDPAADERRFVDAVVASGGLDAHRVWGHDLSLFDALDADLAAVGEPFFTPNLFLTRSLYAAARRLGHDAVLDGFAGDSVVHHGDVWLTELALGLRWRSFLRETRAVAARSRRPRRAVLDLVRDYALAPLVHPVRRPPPRPTFAHPDLPRPAPDEPPYRTARAAHYAELAGPTLPRAFEVAYAAATALGVDPRFPFADRRLVELSLSLPPEQRVRDGLTRWVLRRAMDGRLPDALRDRPGKARIGGGFVEALFERDPDALRRTVYDDARSAAGLIDVPALQAAYERAVRQPETRGSLALPLWRAVVLARWAALSQRTPMRLPAEHSPTPCPPTRPAPLT